MEIKAVNFSFPSCNQATYYYDTVSFLTDARIEYTNNLGYYLTGIRKGAVASYTGYIDPFVLNPMIVNVYELNGVSSRTPLHSVTEQGDTITVSLAEIRNVSFEVSDVVTDAKIEMDGAVPVLVLTKETINLIKQ